jgi:hypothetical protein
MSLDGLRAWIGEVERKLGKRTRVFLVLTVIAIGIGGAAIYLAIDARESSVSESDVQALQEKLEARMDEVATAPEAPVEAESAPAPQPEESTPKPEGEKKEKGGGSSGGGGATGSIPGGATGGAGTATKLQELVQEAKERTDENE